MGYLNKEEQTRETIQADGWLHSGDIGKRDNAGYLYITGRIKGILKPEDQWSCKRSPDILA